MFIHDTHLPQVLTPWHYRSPEQFERERDRLFRPAWHLVGTLADLPREGSFFTLDVLDDPVIVWRTRGGVRAFLNVCPHRFARLSGVPSGETGARLRCQYHGWEFDEAGNTRRIPDARSFRPLAPGECGLHPFRTETCGQLVFVNLSDDPPSLRDWLGGGYEAARRISAADRAFSFQRVAEVEVNWKARMENALEDYHFATVHPGTLGHWADAEAVIHELHRDWNLCLTPVRPTGRVLRFVDGVIRRLASVEFDDFYRHQVHYPSLVFGDVRLFGFAETCLPLSPQRTISRSFYFCYRGRNRLKARLLLWALRWFQRRFFTRVVQEDAAIAAELNRGLLSPRQPSAGLISVREERCWHFQKYVHERTGSAARLTRTRDVPPSVAPADARSGHAAREDCHVHP